MGIALSSFVKSCAVYAAKAVCEAIGRKLVDVAINEVRKRFGPPASKAPTLRPKEDASEG